MRENKFQSNLIRELKEVFPGSIVLKNDANYIQGFPDLLVLYGPLWVALECKKGPHEHYQPNQQYYIDQLNHMGMACAIYPENKDEVLDNMNWYFSKLGVV